MGNNKQYRAYVVPNVNIEGERKNLVFRSRLISEMTLLSVGEGFLLEGERKHDWNWLNRLMGGVPFNSLQEFFDSLKRTVEGLDRDVIEQKLEDYAYKHNLYSEKWVFQQVRNTRSTEENIQKNNPKREEAYDR